MCNSSICGCDRGCSPTPGCGDSNCIFLILIILFCGGFGSSCGSGKGIFGNNCCLIFLILLLCGSGSCGSTFLGGGCGFNNDCGCDRNCGSGCGCGCDMDNDCNSNCGCGC